MSTFVDEVSRARPLPAALSELGGAAASVRERVASFLAGSETIFLETGASLETLRNQAVSLVQTSEAVVAGAGDDDPVERLAQGCRQMEGHLAASRRSLEVKAQRLRGILAAIERLAAFRHLFRRAASALRMLGMSTSIENARSGMESTGFATVAADVRRLAGLVETRFEGVLEETVTMKRTAEDALVRVTELTGRQGERASSMLAEAGAGLLALRELARSASAVGVRASAVSTRVVESVTSVVLSLQVHDITRQMIEHTLDGLREIELDLAAWSAEASEVAGQAADPHEIGELCRLQAAQLRQARSRLEEALHGIPTSLQTMSAAARELADETCRLGGQPQGGSSLESVEQGVGHATSALREQLRQETEIEAAMTHVTATIAAMLARLRDVERIGHDLKIIGLNAGVEAAKTTQGGRVLSVLARAIQELSTEVGDQTTAFADVVRQIASEASSSSSYGAGAGAGATESAIDVSGGQRIAEELESLLANLRTYNNTLVGAIEVLARVGGSLGRGVNDISSRIRRQGHAVATLGAAEAQLESAGTTVLALSAGGARRARNRRVVSASARYTTEAERVIHRAMLSAAPASVSAPIGGGAGGPAKDLGDNVELF